MDIERLNELKEIVYFNSWLSDKSTEDLTMMLDEAIARQSVKSEEVAEAIEYFKDTIQYISGEPQEKDHRLAITALQAYEPNVSKTETTGVSSDGFSYDAKAKQYQCLGCRDYFYMPRVGNYCPNCGRKLRE